MMQNRRTFFKRILAAAVALGMGATTKTKAHVRSANGKGVDLPKGYAWQRTIFCQFANPYLSSSISWLAKDLSCDTCWGEPFSPDIFAVPNFAVILDRNTLDQEQWAEYLEFREEAEDTTPCILVDELGDGEGWSIDGHMMIRDPWNRGHVRSITKRIREAHRVARELRAEREELV